MTQLDLSKYLDLYCDVVWVIIKGRLAYKNTRGMYEDSCNFAKFIPRGDGNN